MNKYKKLAVNTVVFAIGSIGSKILSFFLSKLYTACFEGGTAEFNTKEILEMFANFLIPLVTCSIQDAIIRYGLDKNYEQSAVFSNAVTVLKYGALGMVIYALILRACGRPVSLWLFAALGAAGGVLGALGDLTFSAVKRSAGIKDFGNLIPGHGGMLDRIDSIMFSIPTAFVMIQLFEFLIHFV